MNDIKNKLQTIAENLPADASWDDTWDMVVQASSTEPVEETCEKDHDGSHIPHTMDAASSESPVEAPDTMVNSQSKLSNEELARKGVVLKIASFTFAGLGFALLIYLDTRVEEITAVHKLLVQVFTGVFLYTAYRIHRTGRFYAQRAKEYSKPDTRPPVLYLRAFSADELAADPKGPAFTEEEQLIKLLETIGPVVSLDNPTTESFLPGAKRISTANEEWQSRIQEIMMQARLIVIRIADTSAVIWEFEQARTRLKTSQVLLMVPASDSDAYESFKLYAQQHLSVTLPSISFQEPIGKMLISLLTRKRRFRDYFSFRGFVCFDHSWEGSYLEPRFTWRAYFRNPINQYGIASLAYCLKPIFVQLDSPWQEPRINWLTTALILLFAGSGVWGLVTKLLQIINL